MSDNLPDNLTQQEQLHESPEIEARRTVTVGLWLLAGVTAMVMLCLWIWDVWIKQPDSVTDAMNETTLGNIAEGKPLLQSHPQIDIAAWRNNKTKRLESYGWLQGHARIAHIPIERAMQIMIARHCTDGPRCNSSSLLKNSISSTRMIDASSLAGSVVCIVQKHREYIPIGSGKNPRKIEQGFLTVLKNTDNTAARIEFFQHAAGGSS